MEWRERTGVVTGAASGIGLAATREFASGGARVFALDIEAKRLDEAVASMLDDGLDVIGLVTDVGDRASVRAAFESIPAPVDFIVNCAASFVSRGIDVTPADWDLALRVNVQGAANVVQEAYSRLKLAEAPAVVNIASVSAHVAQPSRWTYNATKGAIVALTKCMAFDLSADGIRVNVVSPGWIWTPEVEKAADGDRDKWEPIWGSYHLLRRLGEPKEVADAILFLCSTKASFITGTELLVDGGYSAMGPEGLGNTSSFAGSKE